jgi:hypothetical protein
VGRLYGFHPARAGRGLPGRDHQQPTGVLSTETIKEEKVVKKAIFLLGLAGLLFAGTFLLRAQQVGLAWDYDFSADPACSVTQPTDCVKEFHVVDADSSNHVLAVPATQMQTTVTLGRPYGVRRFYAIAVSDTGIESEPSNTLEVVVRPARPFNVRFQ